MAIFFLLIATLMVTGVAQAGNVLEAEPNDTLATAQNINPFFSIGLNVNIENSSTIPWASISGTGNDTYDYYRFTVAAATASIFDIDYGTSGGFIDSFIAVWRNNLDATFTLLGWNDDYPIDIGSTSGLDSRLYLNLTPGEYVVGVAECCWYPDNSGFQGDTFVPSGATYTLQVSTNAAVPLPGALLLLGAGLGRLTLYAHRKATHS